VPHGSRSSRFALLGLHGPDWYASKQTGGGAVRTMLTKIALLLCLAVLAGCAVQPRMSTDESLGPDEGVVVATIHTNWPSNDPFIGHQLVFEPRGGSGVMTHKAFNVQGTPDFQVLKLKAGEYKWLVIGSGTRRIRFAPHTGFHVLPGRAVYIGDIHIDWPESSTKLGAARVSVRNEEAVNQQKWRTQYPKLAEKYVFNTLLTAFAPY